MIITTVSTSGGMLLPLGRQLEHDAREIWFDLTWLIDSFGEGEAELAHQRKNDSGPYTVTTTREGKYLIWKIRENDTAYEGFGRAEIRWTFGDGMAKTVIYRTNVLASMTADEIIPDALQSWYDLMIEYIDQLKVDSDARLADAVESASDSADAAENMASEAAQSAYEAAESATQADNASDRAAASETNAAASADAAAVSADRAEQAAGQSGYMFFYIDENGDLHYQRTANVNVDFYLKDGDLYVRAES